MVIESLELFKKQNPQSFHKLKSEPSIIWHDLTKIKRNREILELIDEIIENQEENIHVLYAKRPKKIIHKNMETLIKYCLFVNESGYFRFKSRPKLI